MCLTKLILVLHVSWGFARVGAVLVVRNVELVCVSELGVGSGITIDSKVFKLLHLS